MPNGNDMVERARGAILELGLDDELQHVFLRGLENMPSEEAASTLVFLDDANRQLAILLETLGAAGLVAASEKKSAPSASLEISPSVDLQNLTAESGSLVQYAPTSKANVEAMLTIANTAFASAELLAAFNLNTARGVLEDAVNSVKTLMGAKNPQELLNLQATLAQTAVEKLVAYSCNVYYEISAQSQEESSKIFEAQIADMNKNLTTLLGQAAKSGPAGSDVAVSAVKSAIAAANAAYDSMNKAAKQVADIAEANVVAATDATVKAVGTAQKAAAKRRA